MPRSSFTSVCVMLLLAAACSSEDKPNTGFIPDGGFSNPSGAGAPGGGSGNGGLAGSGNGNGACTDGDVRASRVKPRVILVLDGSCSMTTDYPANGQMSQTQCRQNQMGRWTALRNALVAQNGVVTKLQSVVEFGVVVFGTQPQCPIPGTPVQPALNNLQAITNALPNVQPGQFTPTGPALDWVFDNMIQSDTLDANAGPQLVILATDGEPNSCDNATTNYQPSIDAVTKGRGKNVKTYVISLADAAGAFHDHLQQLANLGVSAAAGTNATLYEPGSPEQLEADLQLLVGGAVGCDIALNGVIEAGGLCQGTVTLNGNPLECNGKDGFILADPRHVRLQGKACETLMMSMDALVDAQFPCSVFSVD